MAKTAASRSPRKSETISLRLDLKKFVPYRVSLLANLMRRAMSEVYRDDPGLTEPEWKVYTTLAHMGPLPSGDIGLHMTLDRMAISRSLTRLIDLGLVARLPYDRDQRMSEVNLTPRGSRVYDRLAKKAVAVSDSILETLSSAEVAEFVRLIDKIEMHFRSYADRRRPTLIKAASAISKRPKAAAKKATRKRAR